MPNRRCFSTAGNTNPVNEQNTIYASRLQVISLTAIIRADIGSVDLSHTATRELQQITDCCVFKARWKKGYNQLENTVPELLLAEWTWKS